MKNKTKIKFGLLLIALIAGVAYYFSPELLQAYAGNTLGSLAAGFTTLATIPIVGAVVDDTVSISELEDAGITEDDIDTEITRLSPNKFPLDTITRNIRKAEKADAQVIQYWQKSSKPMADKLSATASGNGATLASPCNSYTYDSSSNNQLTSICIATNMPNLWRKSDTILMFGLTLPGTKGSAVIGGAGTHTDSVMFYVVDKSKSSIEIIPIGGVKGTGDNSDKWVIPNFKVDTTLVRLGQAKSEKDLTTDPIAILPTSSYQYCQNFITQVEETTFAAMTKKKIDTDIKEADRDNLESMRGEMENSFLFGYKHRLDGANGDTVYFTGGVTREITKTIEYGKGGNDRSMTTEMYMNMLQEVFVGTNGSAERLLLGGSELIKSFELLRETYKNISASTVQETYHGVIVTKVVSTFGTLRLVHAPAFDEIGLEDYGLILDLAYITRRQFLPMVAKELDLISSGQKNAKARTVQECSCVTLKYPDCHAWVKPKA